MTAGYTGNIDNTNSTQRNDGSVVKERNVFDQTLDAGVDLNWTIFDGFNISTTYKELKELERQGATNTRIAIEDFIASLTAEYYNYIQQEIRLKNFRYAVSLSKERLRIVEERYHIGNFSRLDYQQAKVDFNADSAQYMKQQELVHTSRINLNEMMANKDVDRPIKVKDSIIELKHSLDFNELWNATLNTNANLLKADQKLFPGVNYFWISLQMKPIASILSKVSAKVVEAKIDGQIAPLKIVRKADTHYMGVGVRHAGDDGAAAYRIPGLVTSNKGTLVGGI